MFCGKLQRQRELTHWILIVYYTRHVAYSYNFLTFYFFRSSFYLPNLVNWVANGKVLCKLCAAAVPATDAIHRYW